jgi:hypothetical protein
VKHFASKPSRNIVVLLTATIDPRNTPMVVRRDPRQRLDDYMSALRKCWFSKQLKVNLVFCENSNFDIADIRVLCAKNANPNCRTEAISFDGQQYPPHLGKGFGEIGIISHALRHSKLLGDGNPLVVKVTGRLAIRNIRKLLRMIQEHSGFDISCDFRGNLQWADSRIFVASANFLRSYLVPMQGLADDSRGISFEHVLGRASHRAVGDGLRWVPMLCTPQIQGTQATSGVHYPDSWTRWLARDAFRRLKNWVIAR